MYESFFYDPAPLTRDVTVLHSDTAEDCETQETVSSEAWTTMQLHTMITNCHCQGTCDLEPDIFNSVNRTQGPSSANYYFLGGFPCLHATPMSILERSPHPMVSWDPSCLTAMILIWTSKKMKEFFILQSQVSNALFYYLKKNVFLSEQNLDPDPHQRKKSEILIHPDPLPWAADSPCAILYIRTVLATNTRKGVIKHSVGWQIK